LDSLQVDVFNYSKKLFLGNFEIYLLELSTKIRHK
jgi:hypothetical protein